MNSAKTIYNIFYKRLLWYLYSRWHHDIEKYVAMSTVVRIKMLYAWYEVKLIHFDAVNQLISYLICSSVET